MGRFASLHGAIDSLVGFDLFQAARPLSEERVYCLEILSATKKKKKMLWADYD